MKLKIQKYNQEGDVAWEYNALKNFKTKNKGISDFKVDNKFLNLNLETPIDIECQDSYDGTVNLILNDDINPPRLINTRWSRTENDTYKIINRDQINQSNLYREEFLDQETRLFRNTDGVTKLDLYSVSRSGKLKAGNYIFYLKYMDEDYNETGIIAQTGAISIFNGNVNNPSTIKGAFMEEETDKSISLQVKDMDTSFPYFNLYVYRTSCDSNGVKIDYAYKIDKKYQIFNEFDIINIDGFEETLSISVEELNIQYNTVDSVKTQAQVQNMMFFANVSKPMSLDVDLMDMSLYIKAEESLSESIGFINPVTYENQKYDDADQIEYYSPLNIYYKLGYWPDEIYRFGVVYIYNDDSLSPVYNLRGCRFQKDFRTSNILSNDSYSEYADRTTYKIPISSNWIDEQDYINTKGVFQFDSKNFSNIIDFRHKEVHALGIKFSISSQMLKDLSDKNIKGLFFVRQNRIPTILCQGYSVGINTLGFYPMIKYGETYIAESFKDTENKLSYEPGDIESFSDNYIQAGYGSNEGSRWLYTKASSYSGLVCVDAYCNKQLQSFFDSSEYRLEKIYDQGKLACDDNKHFYPEYNKPYDSNPYYNAHLIYVPSGTPQKVYHKNGYSTKAGSQEDLKMCAPFEKDIDSIDGNSAKAGLVRGIFTSFIGTDEKLSDGFVYNIRHGSYSESFLREYFMSRMNDKSPFYAISPRYNINPTKDKSDYKIFEGYIQGSNGYFSFPAVFRGDCFTNTVTTRMHRNFTSSSVPINDTIIDTSTFQNNFSGFSSTNFDKINKADVDAVPIGTWLTYKCLSNYNLSLRCIDEFQTEELALMGNPRSFFPVGGMPEKSSGKIDESSLLNHGYDSLLGVKRYFNQERVPYTKDVFDTRIMFSNVQVDGSFKNSYKIFQNLAYQDIDRQYGSITKILPWGVNLLCVFEHGLAIIPINEKALLQTTEGANIHMYGAGVLQKQVVLISDSIGSRWKDSIVKTPIGIYGVDADNHKIWRYTQSKNLEIISDYTVQRFLHDNIDLKESEKYVLLGARNIKSHYNAFKGDIMFTYYNGDKVWNLCYNENMGKWVTRYSWTPLLSENIDHSMFSFDLLKTRIFSVLNTNFNRANKDELISVEYKNGCEISSEDPVEFSLKIKNEQYSELYICIDDTILKGCYWDKDLNIYKEDVINIKDYTDLISGQNPEDNNRQFDIVFNHSYLDNKYLCYYIDIKYKLVVNGVESTLKTYTIGVIKSYNYNKMIDDGKYIESWNNLLLSSIFVHGRSFNADEINYFDENQDNNCLPTKWYDVQHPFEFEFVVNEPKGMHKIFDNLVIISNNVEPSSLEVQITGDVYGFDKESIFKDKLKDKTLHSLDIISNWNLSKKVTTKINWDPIENSYSLVVHQDCMNIKDFGRRLGNIYYNEDRWYITLRPLYFEENNHLKSTKIRDKYAKIRVRYSGEKLAIIVALQTLFTLSYA